MWSESLKGPVTDAGELEANHVTESPKVRRKVIGPPLEVIAVEELPMLPDPGPLEKARAHSCSQRIYLPFCLFTAFAAKHTVSYLCKDPIHSIPMSYYGYLICVSLHISFQALRNSCTLSLQTLAPAQRYAAMLQRVTQLGVA